MTYDYVGLRCNISEGWNLDDDEADAVIAAFQNDGYIKRDNSGFYYYTEEYNDMDSNDVATDVAYAVAHMNDEVVV